MQLKLCDIYHNSQPHNTTRTPTHIHVSYTFFFKAATALHSRSRCYWPSRVLRTAHCLFYIPQLRYLTAPIHTHHSILYNLYDVTTSAPVDRFTIYVHSAAAAMHSCGVTPTPTHRLLCSPLAAAALLLVIGPPDPERCPPPLSPLPLHLCTHTAAVMSLSLYKIFVYIEAVVRE